MINFGSFYQLIAQDERLFHWLDTLPAQLSEWRSNALHGHFSSWERMLDGLPDITPTELDLKNGVIANRTPALSAGEQLGLNNILKSLMPWRKGPFSLYGSILIQNGAQIGNGIVFCLTFRLLKVVWCWMSVVAVAITCGEC
ncbi:tRNA (mo5U34)-methyltransferase [Proteus vulgaris]|nr:tRNA (mo5U34)-methyltransferase [Proteus vulgaris]